MKIDRKLLSLTFLTLIFLFNLIGINVNNFVGSIYLFLFLMIFPGILIMLMLKIRDISNWEYFTYAVGLSITFLMLGGLMINWLLPWLNITSRPLSQMPLLICFDIFFAIFGIIAYRQNKILSIKLKSPKLNLLNKVLFVIPIIFPLLSVLGATTLNNGGANNITSIMLILTAVYIFAVVLMRQKLDENIYPYSILLIGTALLFMSSFRNYYISGSDINGEFLVFQITKNAALWLPNSINAIYNACLSITILPTIISNFSVINDNYIYKFLFQFISALSPLVTYLILKKYIDKLFAYLSCIFLISFPSYYFILPMHIRTAVALFLFYLIASIIFNKILTTKHKMIMFTLISASLVVSH